MKQSQTIVRNTLIVGRPEVEHGEIVNFTDARQIAVNETFKYMKRGFEIVPDEFIQAKAGEPDDDDDGGENDADLGDISKSELLAIANDLGLELPARATKADIANAIQEEQ